MLLRGLASIHDGPMLSQEHLEVCTRTGKNRLFGLVVMPTNHKHNATSGHLL